MITNILGARLAAGPFLVSDVRSALSGWAPVLRPHPPWSGPRAHFYPVPLFTLPDKYAVRFIPHENGVHTIDVKFNGSHVVGSPFKVRVGEPGQAGNPALVSAYGSGLEGGTTGNTLPLPLVFNGVVPGEEQVELFKPPGSRPSSLPRETSVMHPWEALA